ncbi:chromosome replication initiation inhibitor protein [Moritella sp. Urea-trap-13]|uniref:chromosome replication initiation inhibitor protein n=1 Tax=Moritella sp. Urea-trap-13 TaxID=2058327 RepID=UPI000C339D5F|nr:chromosome replication initiation inhibitor protein [Moritella sp. Urea-trap-13]PKH07887.1 chromosome replication initiation inhibitor protein [Moritella sp. Urea-trap-13]
MFSLFIKVISPFFIFLGLLVLYSYATGQDSRQLIEAFIDLISMVVNYISEVFSRP